MLGPEVGNAQKFRLNNSPGAVISYCKLNGTVYKATNIFLVGNDLKNDNPTFGLVTHIVKCKYVAMVYKRCVTVGRMDHVKGYKIILPTKNCKEDLFRF